MDEENSDWSLYYDFHINPAIVWIIIALPFDVQCTAFSFDTFSILNPVWLAFCKSFYKIFTTNNVCPWSSIFLRFWSQIPCQSDLQGSPLQKYFCILIIRDDLQCEFRIFVIMINTIVNLRTWLYVGRLFDCSMICFVIFVNYFIHMINVHIFYAAIICISIFFFKILINLSPKTDFSSLSVKYLAMKPWFK